MTSTVRFTGGGRICERRSGLSNVNVTAQYTVQQTEPGAMTVSLFFYTKGKMDGGGAGAIGSKGTNGELVIVNAFKVQ